MTRRKYLSDITIPPELQNLDKLEDMLRTISEDTFDDTIRFLKNYMTEGPYIYDVFLRLSLYLRIRKENKDFYIRLYEELKDYAFKYPHFIPLTKTPPIESNFKDERLKRLFSTNEINQQFAYTDYHVKLKNEIKEDDFDSFNAIMLNMSEDEKEKLLLKIDEYEYFIPMTATLLEYVALNGSINIFKYLFMSYENITPSVGYFASFGGNLEIIRLLQQENQNLSMVLLGAIHSQRDDIYDWAIDNLEFDPFTVKNAYESYNLHVFISCFELNFPPKLISLKYSYDLFKYLIDTIKLPLERNDLLECAYMEDCPIIMEKSFRISETQHIRNINSFRYVKSYESCLDALTVYLKNINPHKIVEMAEFFKEAVEHNCTKLVEAMLHYGFDVNAIADEDLFKRIKTSEIGNLMIEYGLKVDILIAINYFPADCLKVLISKGINPNKPGKYYIPKLKPLPINAKIGEFYPFHDPFPVHLTNQDRPAISYFSIKNFTNKQEPLSYFPLHYAVQCGSIAKVQILVESGADVNNLDENYRLPIFYSWNNSISDYLLAKSTKIELEKRIQLKSLIFADPNSWMTPDNIYNMNYNISAEAFRISKIMGSEKITVDHVLKAVKSISHDYFKEISPLLYPDPETFFKGDLSGVWKPNEFVKDENVIRFILRITSIKTKNNSFMFAINESIHRTRNTIY